MFKFGKCVGYVIDPGTSEYAGMCSRCGDWKVCFQCGSFLGKGEGTDAVISVE